MDLGAAAGFPVTLAEGLQLVFGDGITPIRPQARTLEELRPVLYNQTAAGPPVVYWMYRGCGQPADLERAEAWGVRFDLTVLVGGLVGGEYPKTLGHYHPAMPGPAHAYPELYQVLAGTAHTILQRPLADGEVDAVVVIEAGPGDLVLIPPGYGHVTINRGESSLVLANWVAAACEPEYQGFRQRRGAAYYEVEHTGRGFLIPNPHYAGPPPPRLVNPQVPGHLGMEPGEPLYRLFQRDPAALAFLSDPAREVPRAWD